MILRFALARVARVGIERQMVCFAMMYYTDYQGSFTVVFLLPTRGTDYRLRLYGKTKVATLIY